MRSLSLVMLLLAQFLAPSAAGTGCRVAGGPACCASIAVVALPGERPCCAARRIAAERADAARSCCGDGECRCHLGEREDEPRAPGLVVPSGGEAIAPTPRSLDLAWSAACADVVRPRVDRVRRAPSHNRRLARLGRRLT